MLFLFDQDEYDELLKYAVVVPSYDGSGLLQSLTDFRGSFPQHTSQQQQQYQETRGATHRQAQRDDEADDEDGMLSLHLSGVHRDWKMKMVLKK